MTDDDRELLELAEAFKALQDVPAFQKFMDRIWKSVGDDFTAVIESKVEQDIWRAQGRMEKSNEIVQILTGTQLDAARVSSSLRENHEQFAAKERYALEQQARGQRLGAVAPGRGWNGSYHSDRSLG